MKPLHAYALIAATLPLAGCGLVGTTATTAAGAASEAQQAAQAQQTERRVQQQVNDAVQQNTAQREHVEQDAQ